MKSDRESGFSLIELIVVLVLLGALVAVVAPNLMTRGGDAKSDVARLGLSRLEGSLDMFYFDVGRYPTTREGLEALVMDPDAASWRGPYLKSRRSLIDPWGKQFQYRSPGENGDYDLWSTGADGLPGGEGNNADVTSW